MSQTKKTIINILIGLVIGLGLRYVTDFVYEAMRKGGLTPELPFVHTDEKGDVRKTDVYLIPFDGFSEIFTSQVAKFLSQDLGIVIKSTGSMPRPEGTYDPQRKQHVAERFYEPLYNLKAKFKNDCNPNTVFIGIIADDICSQNKNWNFCFNSNFNHNISIVATDRLVPYGILNREAAEKIYGERVTKILKRVIGIQYFDLPRSSDSNSLLYSPFMSIDELDQMSFQY